MRRYIVGYSATQTGLDALHLGISLAAQTQAQLDIVFVIKHHDVFHQEYPPTGDCENILVAQAFTWLEEALSIIPDSIIATARVISSDSTAHGLEEYARQSEARVIIVGGSASSAMFRHKIGRTARELLEGSPVPVALAPRGYKVTQWNRVTCAVGTLPSSVPMLRSGIYTAVQAHVPLRLLSLWGFSSEEHNTSFAEKNVLDIFEKAQSTLRTEPMAGSSIPEAEIVFAHTNEISDAVEDTHWTEKDLLFVGSARVAEPKTVFAGSVLRWLLKYLTIPIVVVPRDHD